MCAVDINTKKLKSEFGWAPRCAISYELRVTSFSKSVVIWFTNVVDNYARVCMCVYAYVDKCTKYHYDIYIYFFFIPPQHTKAFPARPILY